MLADHEIRTLCERVLQQGEDVEAFQIVLSELRAAIRKHFAKIENEGIHLVPKISKIRVIIPKNGTTG